MFRDTLNRIEIPPALKFTALFVACGLFANYFAIARIGCTPYYHLTTLPQLLAGTAPAPFQYRALFLWVISAIQHQGVFCETAERLRDLCYIFEFFFCYALFAVTWLYLGLFIRSNRIKAVGLLLLMFVLWMTYRVPTQFSYYYIWDIPAAVFFTLGLYLIHQNRMLAFYALYAVASLNRETFAFLTVVYLCVNWHRPKRQLLLSCAMQVLIAVAVRAYLVSMYGLLPAHHLTLGKNLTALLDPYAMAQLLCALGFLWVFPLLGWRLIQDTFLKRACLVLPVIGVAAISMTNVDEIRAYGEYVGIILPPTLLVLQRIFADANPPVPTVQ